MACKFLNCLFVVSSLIAVPTFAQSSKTVTADGAELKLVIDSCKFTEGPAVDKLGNVFFTDQPNDRIMKIDLDGNVSEFMKPAGRSNGMFFAPDGKLIACADENNEMWEIDLDTKTHKVLFGTYSDKKMNGPNDVWIHSNGTIYFSDPYYQRTWWTHRMPPQEVQGVYRASRDGKNIQRIDEAFEQPNGIHGDASKSILYVADIRARKTYSFRIAADGSLTDRKLFCESGSDGMTVDKEGNVYLSSGGIQVYSPSGEKIQTIAVPKNPANVRFGGRDRKTLYITARENVYSIQMKTAGQ